MRNSIPITSLLLLTGLLTSCSTPAENDDLRPSVAIVYGIVFGDAHEPVAGAEVAIEAFATTCDSGLLFTRDRAVSDGSGFYRVMMGGPHVSQATTCLKVHVVPPTDYTEAVVTGAEVTFVHQSDTPPVDSVRVDVEVVKAQ